MADSISLDGHVPDKALPSSDRVDLPINGMSCASCARRIEKQLGDLSGVRHAGVNFASARATVDRDRERSLALL